MRCVLERKTKRAATNGAELRLFGHSAFGFRAGSSKPAATPAAPGAPGARAARHVDTFTINVNVNIK